MEKKQEKKQPGTVGESRPVERPKLEPRTNGLRGATAQEETERRRERARLMRQKNRARAVK